MLSTNTRLVLGSLLLTTFAAAGLSAGPPEIPDRIRLHLEEARSQQAAVQRLALRHGTAKAEGSWAPDLEPSSIDVQHYAIDLTLDLERKLISGHVQLSLVVVEDDLEAIALDADQGLAISSVMLEADSAFPADSARSLQFTHANDRVVITIPRTLASGDELTLRIGYGGHAERSGQGVNWSWISTGPVIHTQAEPFGARVWWPCNDRPDDKATVELRVTAPSELVVASNGLQESRVEHANGTATTTWSSQYEVASYLVVMNVSDFAYSEESYTTLDGSTMPVVTYAYPFLADAAEEDLAVTPTMIEVLASHFGEYPFTAEKYGNCTTPFGGGMEHQTLTTIAAAAIGSSWMDWLNVHELAHQWWGDWVTCDDWRELWLNEGSATYAEWLWAEHLGPATLAGVKSDSDYLGHFLGALYDNPVAFSNTVYEKGAWVLNMLRQVVGDEVFFDGLQIYRERFAAASATSEDLRQVFEDASGQDLDWFFEEWVYGKNRPHFLYSWEMADATTLRLTIEQTHTNAPFFKLPMDFALSGSGWSSRHTAWLDAVASQEVEISVPGPVTDVQPDPDTELLAEIAHISEPDLELGPEFPGPFDSGLVQVGQSREIRIPLTNRGGAELTIDSIFSSDGRAYDVLEPDEIPLTLAPGESRDLVVLFQPTSIGEFPDYLWIDSNDPDRPENLIRLEGTGFVQQEPMLITSSSIDFGAVPVGSLRENTSIVTNLGGSDVTVRAELEGTGFATASMIPSVLPAVGRLRIILRFQPLQEGPATGTLVLKTSDPNQPEIRIALAGEGTPAPRLALNPTPVNLPLSSADLPEAVVTLSNAGGAELELYSLSVGEPFNLSGWNSAQRTLAPGAELELTLALASSVPGSYSSELEIYSNDSMQPLRQVPVYGYSGFTNSSRAALAAAASSAGLGGAQWSTDAAILNPDDEDAVVALSFKPAHAYDTTDLVLGVPAGCQRNLSDVVGALGHSGAGGVLVSSTSPSLLVESRTFSREDGGTYGQRIPGLWESEALTSDQDYLLPGLASGGFHTNLGLLNLADAPLQLQVELFASDGSKLRRMKLVAGPGGHSQSTAVFSALGPGELRGAYAVLRAAAADAHFLAYASVVDDASHDPSFIRAVPVAATGASELVIPVVSSAPGDLETRWITDLYLVTLSSETQHAVLEFQPAAGGDRTPVALVLTGPGSVFVEDVVDEWFSATGNGIVRISSDGPLSALSRTYNDAASGTYGQTIPALPLSAVTTPNQVVYLPGLRSDGGFRTNIGLSSISDHRQTVRIELFDDTGKALGTIFEGLEPHRFVQVHRVLGQEIGYTGRAWARLSSDDPEAAYVAHASVIDEETGDPVYIPARPAAQ